MPVPFRPGGDAGRRCRNGDYAAARLPDGRLLFRAASGRNARSAQGQGDRVDWDADQAAIVVCDLTGVGTDFTAEVRRRAVLRPGIPAANIVVCATHSHTAPDYGRDLYEYLDRKPLHGSRYSETLINRIVEAIVTAQTGGRPSLPLGRLGNTGDAHFVQSPLRDARWQRPHLDELQTPKWSRSAGPIDPEVGLLLVRSAETKNRSASSATFALHLDTVGGLYWSGDYPYYVEQELRKSQAPGLVSIFGNGCCGDINHIDPNRAEKNKTEFIGRSLATTHRGGRRLAKTDRATDSARGTRSFAFRCRKCRRPTSSVREMLLKAARAGQKVDFFEHVMAYKTEMLDGLRNQHLSGHPENYLKFGLSHTLAGSGDSIPVDVHAICLGQEVAIVCLPGEVFVELGTAIKRGSPFRTTFVVELSDCVETLYIPTRARTPGAGTRSRIRPFSRARARCWSKPRCGLCERPRRPP